MALIQQAKVTDSRIPKNASENIRRYLEKMNGKNVQIEIKTLSNVSQQQYGYLFAVVYPCIANALKELHGEKFSVYDIDVMMKIKFWYSIIVQPDTAEVTRIPNTKTKMNKAQMVEFIDDVINWATITLQVEIPVPQGDYDYNVIEYS